MVAGSSSSTVSARLSRLPGSGFTPISQIRDAFATDDTSGAVNSAATMPSTAVGADGRGVLNAADASEARRVNAVANSDTAAAYVQVNDLNDTALFGGTPVSNLQSAGLEVASDDKSWEAFDPSVI